MHMGEVDVGGIAGLFIEGEGVSPEVGALGCSENHHRKLALRGTERGRTPRMKSYSA